MSAADAISLTRSLLAFDTINPPGREHDCARHAGSLLEDWGFSVTYHEYAPGRTSVVARAGAIPRRRSASPDTSTPWRSARAPGPRIRLPAKLTATGSTAAASRT